MKFFITLVCAILALNVSAQNTPAADRSTVVDSDIEEIEAEQENSFEFDSKLRKVMSSKKSKKKTHLKKRKPSVAGIFLGWLIIGLGIVVSLLGLWFGWIPILTGLLIIATGIMIIGFAIFGNMTLKMSEGFQTFIKVMNGVLLVAIIALAIVWLITN